MKNLADTVIGDSLVAYPYRQLGLAPSAHRISLKSMKEYKEPSDDGTLYAPFACIK